MEATCVARAGHAWVCRGRYWDAMCEARREMEAVGWERV